MAEFNPNLYFRVAILTVLLTLVSGDCVDLDLGMENGNIPDSKITASSVQSASTPAKNGRLNYASGSSWCAGTSDTNPYLQIDLQTLHIICAVSTQGNSQADQWVKNYTLKLSTDGIAWTDYKEGGQVKFLEGNDDRNSEVKRVVYNGVLTKYLQFLPVAHQGGVCMRVEVFGVKQKPENLALGKATSQSSTFNNTQSGVSGVSRKAVDGNANTDFSKGHCSHTTNDNPSWWRVDLGSDKVPVSEVLIVNRFSLESAVQDRNKDYEIALSSSTTVANKDKCLGDYSFIDFKASAVCFINPLTTGRYITIKTTKQQILQLCEVEIYSRENLAYGKQTYQYKGQYKDGNSSKAVDGNSNTNFQSGRPEGSCTMSNGRQNQPWWRVDLGQDELVTEVYLVNRGDCCGDRLNNFEIRVGTVSSISDSSMTNPRCGGSHSVPVSKGASFFCHPSLKGRYVTIRNLKNDVVLTLCEVEVYAERRACHMQAIGVASEDAIPDNSFSSSSEYDHRYVASKARLNGDKGWAPKAKNNPNDFLQIDLQYEYVICAVATQGYGNNNEWTTKYKIQLSLNSSSTWVTYQENNVDKVFHGNSERNDIVKHSFQEFASARFIRFQPTTYSGYKALRVEVYGILVTSVPSQAPSGLTLTASSSTSITASWQLPPEIARHGRSITGFKLFYQKNGSSGPMNMSTINNGATLFEDVTGLEKFSEYEFQVLAFTSDGDGPKSSVKVERTKEDVPSKAPNTFTVTAKNSTSITASWELPPADSQNGIITGFKLFYKKKGSGGPATMVPINSGGTLSRVVTGLDKYTQYEFQVLAFTSVGDGTKSSVKVERTKEDVPSSPPRSFSLIASSSTSITASWQLPPADYRNGIITGFKLFYKKKGSSESPFEVRIDGNATLTKDAIGLNKYTEYEFQVLAFTSVGDGPKSSFVVLRTKEDAPSKAPTRFRLTAISSTSIRASWQLPPADSRHGKIKGFKLFYKKKDPAGSDTTVPINSGSTLTEDVTGLEKYTEYEFQVLAFTSVGDGPKSSVVAKRTKEDAPSAPESLYYTEIPPSKSLGPKINLTWSKPAKPNGDIRSYTFFYSRNGGSQKKSFGEDTLSYTVDVLGGVPYQFHVRAVTIKPGPNKTLTLTTKEYKPSVGPDNVSYSQVNKTAFNISWAPLPREKSYGKVTEYEVKANFMSKGKSHKRSVDNSRTMNTTATFAVLSDFGLCSKYSVSVRAYTKVGHGPYSQALELETSRPEAPGDFKAINVGTNQVTLTWKQVDREKSLVYNVKYIGTKSYDANFEDSGAKTEIKATTYKVDKLFPGTAYKFEVYGTSDCGKSISKDVSVTTEMMAPKSPVALNIIDVEVSATVVDIHLWPVEQDNGPVSAYQVIVLKVSDGVQKLPGDYGSKLKGVNDAKKDNLNFYVAAEIENDPVRETSWKFTVGDDKTYGDYVNEALEKGKNYIVYERAVTREKDVFFGEASQVAKITVTPSEGGTDKETKGSGSNAVAIAVPVVLLILLIPAVVVAVFMYRRRKQSRPESASERSVQLDDIKNDSPGLTASTSNLVYQNVAEIHRPAKDAEEEPANEEKEAIYSEAEDGKPKPIPVVEFAKYFKNKSENGAIVLREEFKNLPGGLQFPWEVGKGNRGKNRYGNIVSYDHSRVLLEKINGDRSSDYINASYIPTYDEISMSYIATQGPTSTTINDFWRMIWQENCSTIVMLTNLVELGKGKCDQYWPDSTKKYGAITVTLHKTETFADYVIRTFVVIKDSEKRHVQQFHYVTWPDKGVPQHSTALLGFRWKIHVRHQATGGPLVVHCSAGVGRTGTYIGIDAMMESAEKKKTVFIQNYVQVMRRARPHMVQKDDQYVFLHQAVMEALVCGDTEILPQDLRITMNKLARVYKPSKKTGYAREFKRLEIVTDAQASQEQATAAFKPANVSKNRFPNIVPLDTARVILQAAPEKSYINASYVDDYRERNAYILTQAPLDSTVGDFWRMISQYDIGTVVMLNNLKEGKQSYPQYWPSEGSAKYGDITVQRLSENTSNYVTTRRFSVANAAPPKKTSAVHHIQFTGWASGDSCPDPQDILDLLTAVQQSQQQTGNGVVVFQCSDGTGRSGCVSTIMSVIERVKIEQTVDVFQTVKLIRAKRPGAVNTLGQYMFCYKTIEAYLDSFSTYSNFAEC